MTAEEERQSEMEFRATFKAIFKNTATILELLQLFEDEVVNLIREQCPQNKVNLRMFQIGALQTHTCETRTVGMPCVAVAAVSNMVLLEDHPLRRNNGNVLAVNQEGLC